MSKPYRSLSVLALGLTAIHCGGRTLGDGFEGSEDSAAGGRGGAGGSRSSGSSSSSSGVGGSVVSGAGGYVSSGSGGHVSSGSGGYFGKGGYGGKGYGGKAGVGGYAGSAPTCPNPEVAYNQEIVDFEEGITNSSSYGTYVFSDTAYDDTPYSYGTTYPLPENPLGGWVGGGAAGSAFAYHLQGWGFTYDSWGAGLGVWIACTDASPFDGVRFYIRGDDVDVRVSVTTASNLPISDGGNCPGDYSTCVPHGVTIHALPGWTEVTIYWSNLSGGAPASFMTWEVMGIGFAVMPRSTPGWGFDLWVDEISFLGGYGGEGGAGF